MTDRVRLEAAARRLAGNGRTRATLRACSRELLERLDEEDCSRPSPRRSSARWLVGLLVALRVVLITLGLLSATASHSDKPPPGAA